MPPKKRRTPKSAVFSVSDVIDQPLHVLANAINALRGRPEPLALPEAMGVAHEGASLLQRAVSAIDRGLTHDALPATIALILDGAGINHDVEVEFGNNFMKHLPGSINDLDTIFIFAVVKQRVPAEVQIDVLEVMQILCDNEQSKELMGQRFLGRLAQLLAGPQLHFALHRALGTAIIQLVKGSTENKLRLGSYRPVCDALLKTTDYFLQQQCLEVLYRVSRQHPRLLDGVRGELPAELFNGIRAMTPSTMFNSICTLLDTFNASREPRMILDFAVKRVDIADAPFTAATKAYFSPEFFIVFVPNSFAENVTIEYSCIRSIKMVRDGAVPKVIFRLKEPPASIAPRIRVGEEGKDTLTLCMDEETQQAFKESKLQTWMVSVMRDAARLSSSGGSSAGRVSHNKAVAELSSNLVAQQLAQQQRRDGSPSHPHQGLDVESPLQQHYPPPHALATPAVALRLDMNTPASEDVAVARGARLVQPQQPQQSNTRAPSASVAAARALKAASLPPSYPTLGGDDASQVLDTDATSMLVDSASKRHRAELAVDIGETKINFAPTSRPGTLASSSTLRLEPFALSPPQLDAPLDDHNGDEPLDAPPPHNSWGSRSKSRAAAVAATAIPAAPAQAPPQHATMEALMASLRDVVEAQTRAQQDEARAIVTTVTAALQAQVTETRATIARDRDNFRSFVDTRFAPYTAVARKLSEDIDQGVNEVNSTSAQIREIAKQQREAISALEVTARKAMPRIRGREDEELRQLERQVDSELSRLEAFFADSISKRPTALFAAALGSLQQPPASSSRAPSSAALHANNGAGGYSAGRLASGLAKVYVS